MALNRRYFLKSSGIALATFAATPSFLMRAAFAQGSPKQGKDHPILITIFQRGAADGISMVVPYGDPHYLSVRPQIGIQKPIDLDGFFGLHPSLGPLKPIYDQGHLAMVHAVGSPDNTRSHFDAQDYMESGAPGNKGVSDGWLNRVLQTEKAGAQSQFRAISMTATMPRSLIGTAPSLAMTNIQDFDVRGGGAEFETMWKNQTAKTGTFDAIRTLKDANPGRFQPENGAMYTPSQFGQALRQFSQIIKADVGLEIGFVDIGGWDTHANQGSEQGQLSTRLRELGQNIAALYQDLGDRMRNVVVLTMTEFGRAIKQNGSGGTDHGHASAMFVAGGPVKGGKVYGKWPGLAPEQLFEGRDLALTTDFRNVFSEILVKHMKTPDVERVFPGWQPGPALGVIG